MSHLKDYRLCWYLNDALYVDFSRQADIEIDNRKASKKFIFSKFQFEEETGAATFFLISNKYNGGHFLPKFKKVDYLLILSGIIDDGQFERWYAKTKNIDGVQLITEIDAKFLKPQQELIFR